MKTFWRVLLGLLGLVLAGVGCSSGGDGAGADSDPCATECDKAKATMCPYFDEATCLSSCKDVRNRAAASGCEAEFAAYEKCESTAMWACNAAHEAQAYGCGTEYENLGLCLP